MSFGFLLAGFLATTNAGRVALAVVARREGPRPAAARDLAVALAAGAVLIVVAVLVADPLLDWLDISPESWRIAAAIVLGATARAHDRLACRVVRAVRRRARHPRARRGVGELRRRRERRQGPRGRRDRAPPRAAGRTRASPRDQRLAAQFLAALQIVVAIALAVSGIRDV